MGVEGKVVGEGESGFVELEACEDVESETLALEGEKRVGSCPVEEGEGYGLVELGFEEHVRGC